MGTMTKRLRGEALVAWREDVVKRGLLAHLTVREIQEELRTRAAGEGGKTFGRGTVGRVVQAIRAEWAASRKGAVDEMIGEDLARLTELEKRWWEKAQEGGQGAREAAEIVLSIMKHRSTLLGLGGVKQSVQVTAGAMAGAGNEGPIPAGAQVKVLVEYVDDRRELGT